MSEKSAAQIAAEKLAGWTQYMQLAQLRVKCCEVALVKSSLSDRKNFLEHAKAIYDFAVQAKGGNNAESHVEEKKSEQETRKEVA